MKFRYPIFTALLFAFGGITYAQKPTEVPRAQDSPVDFSQPENIVLFVVLPIIIVALYFVWRRSQQKGKS